jgi:hypothetical protein
MAGEVTDFQTSSQNHMNFDTANGRADCYGRVRPMQDELPPVCFILKTHNSADACCCPLTFCSDLCELNQSNDRRMALSMDMFQIDMPPYTHSGERILTARPSFSHGKQTNSRKTGPDSLTFSITKSLLPTRPRPSVLGSNTSEFPVR